MEECLGLARKIRSLMALHGVTNVKIAEHEGVSAVYVSYVINSRRTGYRIRQAVANAVGTPVEQLWPDTPQKYRQIPTESGQHTCGLK